MMSEEKRRIKEFHGKLHDSLMLAVGWKDFPMERKINVLQLLHRHEVKTDGFTSLNPDDVVKSIMKIYIEWKNLEKFGSDFQDFLNMIEHDVRDMMKEHLKMETNKSISLTLIAERYRITSDEDERERIRKEIINRFGFA